MARGYYPTLSKNMRAAFLLVEVTLAWIFKLLASDFLSTKRPSRLVHHIYLLTPPSEQPLLQGSSVF